jgi:hypothetical protein
MGRVPDFLAPYVKNLATGRSSTTPVGLIFSRRPGLLVALGLRSARATP